MTQFRFRAYGTPKGQPRPKAFARRNAFGQAFVRVYDPGTAEHWKTEIAAAARPHLPTKPIEGPVEVALQFIFPRPKAHLRTNGQLKPAAPAWHTSKPDADNAAKAVLDALTVLRFWKDDDQVAQLTVTKQYGEQPGALVVIRALCPPQLPAEQTALFKTSAIND